MRSEYFDRSGRIRHCTTNRFPDFWIPETHSRGGITVRDCAVIFSVRASWLLVGFNERPFFFHFLFTSLSYSVEYQMEAEWSVGGVFGECCRVPVVKYWGGEGFPFYSVFGFSDFTGDGLFGKLCCSARPDENRSECTRLHRAQSVA